MFLNRAGSGSNQGQSSRSPLGPSSPSLQSERLLRTIVITGSAVLAGTGHAWATDLAPAADAHVNSARTTTNYGTLSNLNVGNGFTSFIRFDLSTLPFGTTADQVSKATLRLYVNRVVTGGTVNLSLVNAAWNESTVTYANGPASSGLESGLQVVSAGQFVTIDVTNVVKQWVSSPSTNYGLALGSSGANVLFDSKENDATSHGPLIDVVLASQGAAGATGATGPTGPAGPTGPQGVSGSPGATGATGPAGPGGSGSVGPTGAQGQQGPTGPQGPQGTSGSQGPAGATGAQGPAGSTGPQGLVGATGAQGPQGPVGTSGPQGSVGPAGAAGAIAFAANIDVSGYSGSSGGVDQRAFPIGSSYIYAYGSEVPSTEDNVLPVPTSCVASNWTVNAAGGDIPNGSTGTISLVVASPTGATQGIISYSGLTYSTALSCSVTFLNGRFVGCTAGGATASLTAGSVIGVRVQLSRTPQYNDAAILTSFVCR